LEISQWVGVVAEDVESRMVVVMTSIDICVKKVDILTRKLFFWMPFCVGVKLEPLKKKKKKKKKEKKKKKIENKRRGFFFNNFFFFG